MGRIDPSIPGCSFTQSSDEIQKILNNVAGLSDENVSELIGLLNEIKNITDKDDDKTIGQQLLNALDSMVKEDEVQTELNDSTYPPQSKVVKDAIEAHKNAIVLDHPDGSITTAKINNKAITTDKIYEKAITTDKIADGAIGNVQIRNGSITEEKLDSALKNNIKNTNENLNSLSEFIGKDGFVSTVYVYSTITGTKTGSEDGIFLNGAIDVYTVDENGDYDLDMGWSGKTYIGIDTDTYSEDTYLYIYLVIDNGKYRFELYNTLIDESVDFGKGNASIYVARIDVKTSSLGNYLDISNIEPFERILTESDIFPLSGLTVCGAINKNSAMITSCQSKIADINNSIKGTWHYGDVLTHTENAKPVVLNVGAKAGDFYLNTQHFYVYYTQNGTDWTYIGNLAGSVDTTKWAPITSPDFKGTPMADTPAVTNNSRQIATTAFVRNAIIRYASGGDNTGNIGNILVPLFLSQVNVTVNIWVSDESPMYIGEITNVTATKSWIAASTPTIDYKTTTWSATELTDMVLYCQITNVGIYVGICSENNVPYGALTSALPNSVGSTVVTLI